MKNRNMNSTGFINLLVEINIIVMFVRKFKKQIHKQYREESISILCKYINHIDANTKMTGSIIYDPKTTIYYTFLSMSDITINPAVQSTVRKIGFW